MRATTSAWCTTVRVFVLVPLLLGSGVRAHAEEAGIIEESDLEESDLPEKPAAAAVDGDAPAADAGAEAHRDFGSASVDGGGAGPGARVEDGLSRAGDATERGVSKGAAPVGRGLDRAMKATGRGIRKAIEKTGEGLERAGQALTGER